MTDTDFQVSRQNGTEFEHAQISLLVAGDRVRRDARAGLCLRVRKHSARRLVPACVAGRSGSPLTLDAAAEPVVRPGAGVGRRGLRRAAATAVRLAAVAPCARPSRYSEPGSQAAVRKALGRVEDTVAYPSGPHHRGDHRGVDVRAGDRSSSVANHGSRHHERRAVDRHGQRSLSTTSPTSSAGRCMPPRCCACRNWPPGLMRCVARGRPLIPLN